MLQRNTRPRQLFVVPHHDLHPNCAFQPQILGEVGCRKQLQRGHDGTGELSNFHFLQQVRGRLSSRFHVENLVDDIRPGQVHFDFQRSSGSVGLRLGALFNPRL